MALRSPADAAADCAAFLPAAIRLARRVVDDEAAAEDAAQDALAAILDGRIAPPAGEAARTWFLATAYRFALNHRRGSRRRQARHLASPAPPALPPPDRQVEDAELRGRLGSALAELDPPTRSALWLHHVDGLSQADVAQVIGRRPGTVASLLHRGRHRLRQRLGGAGLALAMAAWARAEGATIPAHAPPVPAEPGRPASGAAPARRMAWAALIAVVLLAVAAVAVAGWRRDAPASQPAAARGRAEASADGPSAGAARRGADAMADAAAVGSGGPAGRPRIEDLRWRLPDGGILPVRWGRPGSAAQPRLAILIPYGAMGAEEMAATWAWLGDALLAAGWQVACPQARSPDAPLHAEGFADLIACARRCRDEVGDGAPICAVGASFGGEAALRLAAAAPIRFHRVAAVPGRIAAAEASGLRGVPVLLAWQRGDGPGWLAEIRATRRVLRDAGAALEAIELPGDGHLTALPPARLSAWLAGGPPPGP